ncbi:ANKRD13D [Bugula neritina]|uniref:ANKRD13D n=1 Tax=Bugula neritina TaxID=10212 RepID=A0A7J7JHQ0_BUGNE|nr:ANKRD13D [Bugula neritina]
MAESKKSTVHELEKEFPIHWCVWENNVRTLGALLESKEHDIEKIDPRGRSPLHLAISLGHMECVKVLLSHKADANKENAKYWSAVHEATSTGDPDLLRDVVQHRDYQRSLLRTDGIPLLLKKISEAPDFYVEMNWEFTSWVPLVSRMCPSDTYKVYKSGAMVRIDTTLLGFEGSKWERGSRSFVFKIEGDRTQVLEIDHDAGVVYSEIIQDIVVKPSMEQMRPSLDQISERLTAPVVSSYVNTEKIGFERAKSGLWGFRSDKVETVNGYQAKVFNVSNVQFVTQTRTEHLSEEDKKQIKKNKQFNPLESMLCFAEKHSEKSNQDYGEIVNINNPCCITPEEYFDAALDLEGKDVGRPRELSTKTQKFKASISMAEGFPLTLQEQVLPIIDLMAATNAHFGKLKEFITLQLPAGFPVKIEIPIFHILNAKITFGNIFSSDTAVNKVSLISEEVPKVLENGETVLEPVVVGCAVDDTAFDVPSEYRLRGQSSYPQGRLHVDQDDQLLQFAIQQSLLEPTADVAENYNLQEALENLTSNGNSTQSNSHPNHPLDYDSQLAMALAISNQQAQRSITDREAMERNEQEELEKILALSLIEK